MEIKIKARAKASRYALCTLILIPEEEMDQEMQKIAEHWSWIFFSGLIYFVVGLIAAFSPFPSTIGLTLAIGILLLVSGSMWLVQAIRLRGHSGNKTRFFQSILALFVGAFTLIYPGGGVLALGAALSIYFLASSFMQVAAFFAVAHWTSKLWLLVGAVASLFLGLYLIYTLPYSALWIPGFLLGLDFLFVGVSQMGFAISAKRLNRKTPEERSLTGPPVGVSPKLRSDF